MNNNHVCEWLNSITDSTALYINVEYYESEWQLHYKSYATEYDVRDGEADEDGELLSDIAITIQYCPFCGLKLKRKNGKREKGEKGKKEKGVRLDLKRPNKGR